ncbi:MAG: hypothetical protein HJJLKODD_01146 [Phycisphaerae bacterium]|nr:hypothetical protein [Phycisphaerae bacterium]
MPHLPNFRQWLRKIIFTLMMLLLLPACKSEKSTTAPQSPASSNDTSLTQPQQPASSTVASPTASENTVAAADPAKDDPGAPAWLPQPRDLTGWVRSANLHVYYSGQWEQIRNEPLSEAVSAYNIKSVTTGEWTSVHPNPEGIKLRGYLIEAYHPDDAFGLFTALQSGTVTPSVGTLASFTMTGDSATGICWQGVFTIYLQQSQATPPEMSIHLEKLTASLVQPIPSSDPPSLVAALPAANRLPGQLWLVRKHLNTLPETMQQQVFQGNSRAITQALGLSLDTLMLIAAFNPGEAELPNYVFIVRYPTSEQAAQAEQRLQSWLTTQPNGSPILIEKPAGRYLVGTFTIEQESIPTMHMLPQIAANLPKD